MRLGWKEMYVSTRAQADDLKNMDPDKMGEMFSGGGGGGRKPPRKTRSQYRRRLVEFYETYGLSDKV